VKLINYLFYSFLDNEFNKKFIIYAINMIKISKYSLIITFFTIITTNISMALEEPKYQIVKSTKNYEVRKYNNRLAVEVEYSIENSGFRYLFNYISGENTTSEKISMTVPVTQSVKIDMTAPVTQFNKDGKMLMQFYLPSKFTMETAPKPTNKRVKLISIEGGYYAILKYSGRSSYINYLKKIKKLQEFLVNDNHEILDDGTKATFNAPFTLPILRRNEAMIKIKWN